MSTGPRESDVSEVCVCYDLEYPITSTSGALVNYPGGTLTLDIEYCRDEPNYRHADIKLRVIAQGGK